MEAAEDTDTPDVDADAAKEKTNLDPTEHPRKVSVQT